MGGMGSLTISILCVKEERDLKKVAKDRGLIRLVVITYRYSLYHNFLYVWDISFKVRWKGT